MSSLIILNISHNSLKSLSGVEGAVNLRFLNAAHNRLRNCNPLSELAFLAEAVLSHNLLLSLSDFHFHSGLLLVDASFNCVEDIESTFCISQSVKFLSITGNPVEKEVIE